MAFHKKYDAWSSHQVLSRTVACDFTGVISQYTKAWQLLQSSPADQLSLPQTNPENCLNWHQFGEQVIVGHASSITNHPGPGLVTFSKWGIRAIVGVLPIGRRLQLLIVMCSRIELGRPIKSISANSQIDIGSLSNRYRQSVNLTLHLFEHFRSSNRQFPERSSWENQIVSSGNCSFSFLESLISFHSGIQWVRAHWISNGKCWVDSVWFRHLFFLVDLNFHLQSEPDEAVHWVDIVELDCCSWFGKGRRILINSKFPPSACQVRHELNWSRLLK
jgi:hypothetical protein